MLDLKVSVFFFLKKPKNYVKGPVPIYLRITVDGIKGYQRACDPNVDF
jgi:hypothetical protein